MNIVKDWSMLSGEAVEPPALKIIKILLAEALSHPLWLTLLQGEMGRVAFTDPFQLLLMHWVYEWLDQLCHREPSNALVVCVKAAEW